MTRARAHERRSTRAAVLVLGLVVGLVVYVATDLVSARWLNRPDVSHRAVLAPLLTVVLVLVIAFLAWARPRVALAAGLFVTLGWVAGQLLWTPGYLHLDPWAFDPVAFLAFGSQQLLVPAAASLLVVVSGLRLRGRPFTDPTGSAAPLRAAP